MAAKMEVLVIHQLVFALVPPDLLVRTVPAKRAVKLAVLKDLLQRLLALAMDCVNVKICTMVLAVNIKTALAHV